MEDTNPGAREFLYAGDQSLETQMGWVIQKINRDSLVKLLDSPEEEARLS